MVECYICNTKAEKRGTGGILVKGGFFSKELISTCRPCRSILIALTIASPFSTGWVLSRSGAKQESSLLEGAKLEYGGVGSYKNVTYSLSINKEELESLKDDIIKFSKRIILDEKRKEELIEKYGEYDGNRIFERKILTPKRSSYSVYNNG